MKIDFSGLDPSAPIKGRTDDLHSEISDAPSFALPITTDVSLVYPISYYFDFFFLISVVFTSLLLLNSHSFSCFCYSSMGFRKQQYRW